MGGQTHPTEASLWSGPCLLPLTPMKSGLRGETEGGLGQTTAYGARRKEGLKGKSLIMAAGELGGEERLTVTWHPRSLQSSVL